MSTDIYTRLLSLLPQQPITTAVVVQAHLDGTATVQMPGGAQTRVRNPLGATDDAHVYLQGGAIVGDAPALVAQLIEI